MHTFSQRLGLEKPPEIEKVAGVNDLLRRGSWNVVHDSLFDVRVNGYVSSANFHGKKDVVEKIWKEHTHFRIFEHRGAMV